MVLWLLMAFACAPQEFGTGPEVWSEPTDHIGDGWLFSHQRINRIDIEIDAESVRILEAESAFTDPRTKVRARVVLDGEEAGVTGLRLRGRLGGFGRFDRKPKLALDFNAYQPGNRFHGLEALALNNVRNDCAAQREAIAAEAVSLAGVPGPRVGYAQVFLNGADYGLYYSVEAQDDRWMRRVFGENDGNLYDGKYRIAGWVPHFVDFDRGDDLLFELEEGEDVGHADIRSISSAVADARESGSLGRLADAVAWDELLRGMAVDVWIGGFDGYLLGRNNYRVYFPPDGPMRVAMWDLDNTFLDNPQGYVSPSAWRTPRGNLGRACVADPACVDAFENAIREVSADLDAQDWTARLDALDALIGEGSAGDPRRECTSEDVAESRTDLRTWLADRSAEVLDALDTDEG